MVVEHYAKKDAPIAAIVAVKTRVKSDAIILVKDLRQIIGNNIVSHSILKKNGRE